MLEALGPQLDPTPAVLLVASILLAIAYDCMKDIRALVSARNVFLLTILAWYGLESVLLPPELQESLPQEHYLTCLFYVGLSVAAFLVAYHSLRGGCFDTVFRKLAATDNPRLIFGLMLLALSIGFLPLLLIAKGDVLAILDDAFIPRARWAGPFQRGRYGGLRDAMLELQMFLRAAVPLAAAVLIARIQPANRRMLAGCFLIYMIAKAFNSGFRSQVLEVVLPVMAAVYWRLPPRLKKRALYVGLPTFVLLGFIVSAAMVVTRNEGTFRLNAASEAKYVGFEMFRELTYITDRIPRDYDYFYGMSYYVQLVNPIPRAIWPRKPSADAGLELAKMRGAVSASGEAKLTVSPGLIGEMYWNFGIPGILALSGLLGYFAKSWDRGLPLARQSLLAFTVYVGGLAIIFRTGRSFNMTTIYGMLALYVALVIYSTLKPSGSSSQL